MANYTLTLSSDEDYRLIKKLLKAFDGASIRPAKDFGYSIEKALEEARNGDVVGPFSSVDDFMKDLLS